MLFGFVRFPAFLDKVEFHIGVSVYFFKKVIKNQYGDFPGSPVVMTPPSTVGGMGLIPGMANKHMKRSSSSVITREIHIKLKMRYHLLPTRMAIIKPKYNKTPNNK